MKENKYFEEFELTAREWTKAHDEHKAKKDEIISTYGWDSEELKNWYNEEAQMKFPYSDGACKAYRAWKYTEGEEVEMNDFVWEKEAKSFIDTLRKAEIQSFVLTNTSTALMENLHWFQSLGCTIEGLCTITKKSVFNKDEQVMGIRIIVNKEDK